MCVNNKCSKCFKSPKCNVTKIINNVSTNDCSTNDCSTNDCSNYLYSKLFNSTIIPTSNDDPPQKINLSFITYNYADKWSIQNKKIVPKETGLYLVTFTLVGKHYKPNNDPSQPTIPEVIQLFFRQDGNTNNILISAPASHTEINQSGIFKFESFNASNTFIIKLEKDNPIDIYAENYGPVIPGQGTVELTDQSSITITKLK